MARVMIPHRRTPIWPSSSSSLAIVLRVVLVGGLAQAQPAGPARDAGATPIQDAVAGAGHDLGDAQTRLLELAAAGHALFVRRAQRAGSACDEVRLRPSVPDGSAGEIALGDLKGRYAIRRGQLDVFHAGPATDFRVSESFVLHGATRDGVLLGGALLAVSKEACQGHTSYRPLALKSERCAPIPQLGRAVSATADDAPWVFNHRGLLGPCGWAGAYFANGTRYPLELFVPLGRAWLSGPLAGGTGEPHMVDLRIETARLRLGERILEPLPSVLSQAPADAKPARIGPGGLAGGPAGHPAGDQDGDFAGDFLGETRPLYLPVLREHGVTCAEVDLSKLQATITLPSFSGNPRKLEFQKDDFGLSLWPARSERGSLAQGRRAATVALCDGGAIHLAVHGRDADSYRVGGSRWFFDRATCERQHGHVLPALVDSHQPREQAVCAKRRRSASSARCSSDERDVLCAVAGRPGLRPDRGRRAQATRTRVRIRAREAWAGHGRAVRHPLRRGRGRSIPVAKPPRFPRWGFGRDQAVPRGYSRRRASRREPVVSRPVILSGFRCRARPHTLSPCAPRAELPSSRRRGRRHPHFSGGHAAAHAQSPDSPPGRLSSAGPGPVT